MIDFRLRLSANAFSPIFVTLAEIVTDVSPVSAKALMPMFVTLPGIVTSVRVAFL